MLIVNKETITGKEIVEELGLVRGNTVRAKHVGKDIIAGLKNIVGGEIRQYTELLTDARDEATGRMIQEAEQLGANAVLNVRYVTSMVGPNMAELLAYGSAVKVR